MAAELVLKASIDIKMYKIACSTLDRPTNKIHESLF